MKTSQKGIDLLKSFEGCRLKAYQDVIGVWTIGYGSTGADAFKGNTITQDRADSLLAIALQRFEDGVQEILTTPVTQGQFDSLVCFSYNVGLGNLKASHLLQYTNEGRKQDAANEFQRWNKAGGQVVAGLTRRRGAEKELYLS